MFLVGGSRPTCTAPPVRPSAQPFFPPPRSTDGARIKQSGTNLEPAAAGKPSTNARPTEMPMKQREPGEPGRPNGCQDCPSPNHRLLWTVPEDIVRLCEPQLGQPQPGQLHLGQAGPEDQVLSEWLKTTPSRENESGDPEITREPKPARARGSGPGAPSAPCHAFHPPQLRRGEDDIQP